MNIEGEVKIEAPRERVWAALNDAGVLARCIEGCEVLEKTGDQEFSGKVTAKVGPVKAHFSGLVRLSDIIPNQSYTITGEGKGGVAGFAKGAADVRLADAEDGGTRLSYTVRAAVGGKLAQLGNRLIESTARDQADKFFSRLAAELAPLPDSAHDVEHPAVALPENPTAAHAPNLASGVPAWLWSLLLVAAGIALLIAQLT